MVLLSKEHPEISALLDNLSQFHFIACRFVDGAEQ
jgi:hypothetical protein